ncbi:hypothetical protein [Streptomyces fagopyri]
MDSETTVRTSARQQLAAEHPDPFAQPEQPVPAASAQRPGPG